MGLGLLLAFCASVCMGAATVLQAMGARMGPGGPVRAMCRWPFIAGVAVDTLGFLAELVALRSVPLFLVEAAVASSLAVTAIVASRVLHIRLRRAEWGAVVAVCSGLALLAVAAGREGSGDGDATLRWAVLGGSVGLALVGWAVGARARIRRNRAAVMGGLAGLSFGLVAVAARLLPELTVPGIFAEPTVYAVILSGIAGYLMLIEAVQAGSVTAATGAMVIGETVWPAVFGVIWLGDDTRHGLAPVAVAGFAVSIMGALALARFGEAEQDYA